MQRHFIAVSQTDDPEGRYWIYHFNAIFGISGNFWDYPQLGMDQDSILRTATVTITENKKTHLDIRIDTAIR